jgi:4-hydroxybenzoate polyprenyltransferase
VTDTHSATLTLDTRTVVQAVVLPTLRRLQRAEGVLLAINASIILTHPSSLPRMAAQLAVSAIVLALLYAYNDVYDCHADLANPKKDMALVRLLILHRAAIVRLLLVLSVAMVGVAQVTLGTASAVAVAAVLGINVVYSHYFKRMVVVDVLWVGLCGATYILTPGIPLDVGIVLLVGLMTAVSHVFQTLGDRNVDDRNAVSTTAVFSPGLATGLLVVFCGATAWVVARWFGLLAATTAFVPLVAYLVLRDAERAWLVAKAYFAVLWLALLGLTDVAPR